MTRLYSKEDLFIKEDTRSSILIVDDIIDNIKILIEVLGEEDYKFSFAMNGKELEISLITGIPDIILLDIMLPDISGFDILKNLKKDIKTKDIPVIFISAKTEITDVIEGLKLGAVDYITKPFNLHEVEVRVRNHIAFQKAITHERSLIEEMRASIKYASRLQSAIFPKLESFDKIYPENFILYKPKDIVSGDFYWFAQQGDIIYIAAADCTGHGVPGAFMSILGITYLNEIILNEGIGDTDQILNLLRARIIDSLKHSFDDDNPNDGIDMAICKINLEYDFMQYSGAYNSIYLIRDNELIEFKGDRMPIGLCLREERPFRAELIELKKNDLIYLFSDGYVDQFGGENGTKFRAKRFQEFLLTINSLKLENQKELIEQNFENWRGEFEQIDDITVIGLRI